MCGLTPQQPVSERFWRGEPQSLTELESYPCLAASRYEQHHTDPNSQPGQARSCCHQYECGDKLNRTACWWPAVAVQLTRFGEIQRGHHQQTT